MKPPPIDPRATWPAIPIDQLKTLRLSLCRSRSRVEVLGGTRPDVSNPWGMAGLLVGHLRKYHNDQVGHLCQGKKAPRLVPSATTLLPYLRQSCPAAKVSGGTLSQFMQGKISDKATANRTGASPWLQYAWHLVDLILLGTERLQTNGAHPTTDQITVATSIRDYFLGPIPGKDWRYLEERRRWCQSPFDVWEAEQGVARLVDAAQLGARGFGVFASGGAAFVHDVVDGTLNSFGQATIDLAMNGIHVHFVVPDPRVVGETHAYLRTDKLLRHITTRSDAGQWVSRIHPILLDPARILVPPAGARGRWSGEFLHPTTAFTLTNITLPGVATAERTLYVTPWSHTETSGPLPFARVAEPVETDTCVTWFDLIKAECCTVSDWLRLRAKMDQASAGRTTRDTSREITR